MDILEYKNLIEKIIVNNMSKVDNVKSIFVVGSMANLNYQPKELNDYDIRILVSSIDDAFIEAWEETIGDCLALAEKDNSLYVTFSDIIGPVKVVSNCKRHSLLIHGVVLTMESLEELGEIHKRSYYNRHYVLYGDDPLEKYHQLQIEIKNILYDTEGINYCIDHLCKKKITMLKWTKECNKYSLVLCENKFTGETGYEFTKYSVSKSIMNISEYFNKIENQTFTISAEIEAKIRLVEELSYEKYVDSEEKYINIAIQVLEYLKNSLKRVGQ